MTTNKQHSLNPQHRRFWNTGFKEMVIHSSILACRIPWTEEPDKLQSIRLLRVRHDWVTKHACMHTHTHTFSCSHIHMWEFDHKEGWQLKNLFFQTVVPEKTVENLLNFKDEIRPVHPKGNQPWIFTARTDAEAPILWSSDVRSWLTGKDLDGWKDWRQKEKGTAEDEMVRQHHWLDGHKSKQTLGDSEG